MMKKFMFVTGHISLKIVNQLINLIVAILFFLMLSYGTYSIWDNQQVSSSAQSSNYSTYKPTNESKTSFLELQQKNKDVFGWLTVYGTNIDYPLVQGTDNKRYLNTNAQGEYQLSGSLFLDYRNKKNFSDFNSIVFGHHMAKSAMFGDLGKFDKRVFFDKHLYGNVYYEGKNHGVKFFAFLNADAFDATLYQAAISGDTRKLNYLDHLKTKSTFYRDIGVNCDSHLIVLSTCTSNYTNGRHVLVGVVTKNEIAIPKDLQEKQIRSNNNFLINSTSWLSGLNYLSKIGYILFSLLFVLLLFWYSWLVAKRKQRKGGGGHEK